MGSQVAPKVTPRFHRNVALAFVCLAVQMLAGELLGYAIDDYPKLIILGANLALFLIGMLADARREAHFYSSLNVISLASAFVFYIKPMYILHERTDSYRLLTVEALAFLTAFNALFYFAYYRSRSKLEQRAAASNASPEELHAQSLLLRRIMWACWGIGAAFLMVKVIAAGGVGRFALEETYRENTLARTEASFGQQLADALVVPCFVLPVPLLASYRQTGEQRWIQNALLLLCLAAVPGSLLLLRSRRYTIAVVFGLALLLFRNPPRWVKSSALVAAFVSPFLFSYWAAIRALPLTEIDADALQERSGQIVAVLFETTEISMSDEYLKIFNDVGDRLPIRWGADYYKIVLTPIPRAVMPDKPLASGTEFLNHYYPTWFDTTGGAVTISTPGELIWNFGYIGIFGAIFYGWLFAVIDTKWLRGSALLRILYVLGGFYLALGFVRGCHHLVLLEFAGVSWPVLLALVMWKNDGVRKAVLARTKPLHGT